ncbi:MAG: lamin tail domain-containing protein [Bacteroidia bacterium]
MKKILLLFLFLLFIQINSEAQLIVNEVLYDPSNLLLEGDANGDGVYSQTQDEFIELVNTGSSSIDISGYQIWDDTLIGTLVYTFPSGTIIPSQGAVVVFGGGTPIGLFGGAKVLADTDSLGLSLNNSGEIIAIKDNTSKTILTFNSDALSNNPNESYTRNPDLTGSFVQHASINTNKFSPGTKVNGNSFIPLVAKQITFKVDLNAYSGTVDSVFVSGNFNQWCSNCNVMLDVNKDGLWELTLPIIGDTLEYLFIVKAQNNSTQEVFTSVSTCTKSVGNSIYRYAIVKTDSSLSKVCFESCNACQANLELKGITDFITPLAGSSGKAIYMVANGNINNLSSYGIGIANNGNGSNGQEYRFPNRSVSSGSQIVIVRDSAALATYMASCWSNFTHVFVDSNGVINQNGNDAVELFRVGDVIETFGDINTNGTGQAWEYTGSWAFKNGSNTWTYGKINCTDSTTTIFDADCVFPICNLILVSSIEVIGEGNVSAITQNAGTLKMLATVLPVDAYNKNVTWSVDNNTIAEISSEGILTAKANGVVIVKASAKDASGEIGTKSISISGQSTGLNSIQKSNISIFPNPIINTLYIQSGIDINEFKLYSIHGKLIESGTLESNQKDLSHLQSGVYVLDLKINNDWIQYKIIKN